MNKSFWMPNGDVGYDSSSRIEPKRARHWFMDASEPELLCNKKQALEALNGRPMSGFSNANVSLWENTSSFQSGSELFSDRLFGAEPIRTFSLAGQNISSVGARNSNMEIRAFEDQSNDSSISLSTAPAMEDHSSCANYGVRKVKVSQVQSSNKDVPVSMGHSYSKTDNCISLTPSLNDGIGPTFNKADGNFISMGPTFNKEEGNFMLMGYNFNKGDEGIISMSRPFEKANGNFILMDQQYEKEDDNIISMGPAYNKGHENFFPMGISYNRENENFISVGPAFEKGGDNIIPLGPTPDKVASTVVPIGTTYDSGESSLPSMTPDYDKAEGTNIFVGSFQNDTQGNNPSGMIISSYDLLMNQPPEVLGWKNSIESNADQNVSVAPAATSKADTTRRNKEPKPPKKTSPNSFPSNVKSLLSTGILDGVPAKYVSWGRDKTLRALIKGSSYMCGCNDCKLSKALNAYEFERHAGCKTKHPNNHIYFENGKTIYAVVQELKNTSQENLFEAIETVTGSPINEKNFRIWKASYQAATRELQRIYGKDEVVMPSSS